MNRSRQSGYINIGPTGGELLGCLAVAAVFFIVLGIGIAAVAPKVWAWLKPVLQGWLA